MTQHLNKSEALAYWQDRSDELQDKIDRLRAEVERLTEEAEAQMVVDDTLRRQRDKARAEVERLTVERDAFRIEGDHAADDYEDAEEVIRQIAERRSNKPFDPWAQKLCADFLERPAPDRRGSTRADAERLADALDEIIRIEALWAASSNDEMGMLAEECLPRIGERAREARRQHEEGK